MHAVALTDCCNLFGALEFSETAAANGIQPIIGCDLNIKINNDTESSVVLLAKNTQGIKNLMFLSSDSYLNKPPKIDLESINKKNYGLIMLSGNLISDLMNTPKELETYLSQIIKAFGDRFYIELRRDIKQPEKKLIDIAFEHNIPLVGTNASYFTTPEMHEAHDSLLCIAQSRYLEEHERIKSNPSQYLKSQEEMIEVFKNIPEAIKNTYAIAQRCSAMMHSTIPTLPEFPCKKNEKYELIEKAKNGLQERFFEKQIPENYLKRLEYEIGIINQMNYAGYFLIVSDFICWSKNRGIVVGPGRGSGVGSLVAWALKITEPDPIEFGLIFERFLNPERISMPDFDIDFCQENRDKVIQYIKEKYQNVAHIITFGKLQPRAVIRDVGRVLQIPYKKTDEICKMIPHNAVNPVTLSEALSLDKNLSKELESSSLIEKLIKISLKLEGIYRHVSIHAAGIVISKTNLVEKIPVYYDEHSILPISQFSMKYVEKAGLVKFDFLGLKTLTVISKACELIDDKFDISKIKLDDKKTYELLATGYSIGIFQLESAFMKNVLRKLKPDSINDIIALISLNRPGPMANIPSYVARKHGKEQIEYPHPILEEVLKDTFGVIIYQEQVIKIAQIMGGYTLGAADLLRRAMGKKIKSEMEEQRKIFIDGAIEKGIEKDSAEYVFDLVAKFAGYGFNKSHAVAYAIISYQTAYLKAHHTTEFFVALMNLDIGDTDKLNLLCQEAKAQKINILPPNVLCANAHFEIENRSIRYALGALKNVGAKNASSLIKLNKCNSLEEFFKINSTNLGSKTLEALIKSGAFDKIEKNRKKLFESMNEILSCATTLAKDKERKQNLLFEEEFLFNLKEVSDWDLQEKIDHEFESFGFYLFNHPMFKYEKILKSLEDKKNIIIGIVSNIRIRSSNRGRFAIVQISNIKDTLTVIIYDETVIESDLLVKKNLLVIECYTRDSNLTGKAVYLIEDFIEKKTKEILVHITKPEEIELLSNLLKDGSRFSIITRIEHERKTVDIMLPSKYDVDIFTLSEKLEIKILLSSLIS